ncbi:MAG: 2-oxo acid dehydrogenase subunit E2 [Burkholderiales bacterium]|nr:2-oxo acid dehydrogenase subunit E2 [Burkholderiales bacterium]
MGTYTIKMPDIGEGIAEVELVEWRVKPGDEVQEDQVLADVMTDKATVEIPSPVKGKVSALNAKPGEMVPVGTVIVELEVAGAGNVKDKDKDKEKAKAVQAAAVMLEAKTIAAPDPAAATPPAPVAPPVATRPPMRDPGEKPIASPAVRRRAWELGIELQFVHGSGAAGRITHEDLDVYLASRGQPMSGGAAARYQQKHGEEAVPVIGLRRQIAQKMQEAKRRIPHFSYVEEIDVTEVENLRKQLNERYAASRGKLTMLPLIARAVVLAIEQFPQMNARFDDDAGVVTRFQPVHLGVAAQTPNGLMVPVLRHAESHDPWSFAREIARLAEAARTGKATRNELTGSTITITSLGALGGIVTTPVINHPEVAIIGVNRMVERPVLRSGGVVGRMMMNLSSSFDHRVVDGMDAAEFVQAIRMLLETPAMLFVE